MLRDNPDVVGAVVAGLVEGWGAYMKDPKPANEMMGKLNKTMDAETFAAAAEAQKVLIESDDTKASRLGTMTTTAMGNAVQAVDRSKSRRQSATSRRVLQQSCRRNR